MLNCIKYIIHVLQGSGFRRLRTMICAAASCKAVSVQGVHQLVVKKENHKQVGTLCAQVEIP